MISKTTELIKKNAGTSISIASVVAALGFYATLTKVLDQRYCLAGDAQQTQNMMVDYMEKEYEDKIFMLNLKGEANLTDQDKALRKRYQDRLDALRAKKK